MTRDDIIRMARKAEQPTENCWLAYEVEFLERFAALVAAAEREACADILDRNADRCDPHSLVYEVLDSNASAIRARSGSETRGERRAHDERYLQATVEQTRTGRFA